MSDSAPPRRVQAFVSRLLENDDAGWEGRNDEQERLAGQEFGRHVGLNADWSVMAWFLGPGKANVTDGAFYFTDNEDGTWSVLQRWGEDAPEYDADTMGVKEILTGSFEEAFAFAKQVREQVRAR